MASRKHGRRSAVRATRTRRGPLTAIVKPVLVRHGYGGWRYEGHNEPCTKVPYATREEAEAVCSFAMVPYRCGTCRVWHLSHRTSD